MCAKRTVEERFWQKVDKTGPVPEHRPELGPCWLWTAYVAPQGYGQFNVGNGRRQSSHRFSYELHNGAIPDGLHLDHICHDPRACPGGDTCPHRGCCNPAHLEAVTELENIRRGHVGLVMASAVCPEGHPYEVGTNGRRFCPTCKEARKQTGLPPGDSRHGRSGYQTYGCRCAVCREGHRVRAREYAQRVRARP